MRVEYSPEFDRRLDSFYQYIRDELKSPDTAARNVNRILDQCSLLAIMPRMGIGIQTEDGRDTGIRMLILGSHVAIYRITEEYVDVVTLLDVRTKEFAEVLEEIRQGIVNNR